MAWPDDRRPTTPDTFKLIPDIWSAKIINHVRSYLVAHMVVNTEYRPDLVLGDDVYIPVATTASTYTVDPTNTAAIPSNINTASFTTAESITIDHWEESPVIVDDSTRKQTQVKNLLEIAADNAAYALEKSMDTDVAELFDGLSTTLGFANSDGAEFTDDTLIAIMERLDEADVPVDNRSMVGDPSTMADCYKIDKFMTYDYSRNPLGQQVKNIGGTGGYRGTIVAYDLPLYITNVLEDKGTGNCGVVMHRDAIGLVIQDGPDIERWRHPAAHADVVNVTMLWGEDEIRDIFGVPFYTRSA